MFFSDVFWGCSSKSQPGRSQVTVTSEMWICCVEVFVSKFANVKRKLDKESDGVICIPLKAL
jgi:hypothetical protein